VWPHQVGGALKSTLHNDRGRRPYMVNRSDPWRNPSLHFLFLWEHFCSYSDLNCWQFAGEEQAFNSSSGPADNDVWLTSDLWCDCYCWSQTTNQISESTIRHTSCEPLSDQPCFFVHSIFFTHVAYHASKTTLNSFQQNFYRAMLAQSAVMRP